MSNRMLVLVGLPGSGKSTLSNKLVQCRSEWQRVNQDDMKSRKACEMYARKFLDKKQSVIVDRCNFDRDQRKTWIELAQHYKVPVDCIVLTANREDCGNRILVRQNHPTGVTGKTGITVLNRLGRNYFPPRLDGGGEGFSRVLYLDPSPDPECTEERIDEIFALLDGCPPLLVEKEHTPFEKLKITVDEDGWSTIPSKKSSDSNNTDNTIEIRNDINISCTGTGANNND